jgi:bacterioferritin
MRAELGVVEALDEILTMDLTAINQYFLQSEVCRNWGYERLARKFNELSIGEMRDAQTIMRHILYLERMPNMQRLGNIRVGRDVEEQLRFTLDAEVSAIGKLSEAVAHCQEVGDFTTREILEEMLVDERDHVDWVESQLSLIEQVGAQNYMAQQIVG